MSTISILGLQYWDPDILQPMISRLPAGLDPVTLSGELFAQCAEYEILYPDPETFKTILRYWAEGQQAVWFRMAKALEAEYNITENYDRSEEWTDTGSSSGSGSQFYKGYPADSDLVKQAANDNTGSAESHHSGRVHGNIGVRSAQELVEQEIELAAKANLQQLIIDDFKRRFCLLVY